MCYVCMTNVSSMKNLLFAHKHRLWSGVLFILSLITLILTEYLEYDPEFLDSMVVTPIRTFVISEDVHGEYYSLNNLLDEILMVLTIVSGLIFAFSREKVEDELISEIRKKALIIAVYLNYIILILTTVLIYDMLYLYVMEVNLLSTLLFFVIVYHYKRHKLLKGGHEE